MTPKVQLLFIFFLFFTLGFPARAQDKPKDEALPLPRFASLREDKVFVRTGPDQQYPIRWVYQREGMPVEIIQEYDSWRKVRDADGSVGWVHKAMLSGKKMALVSTKEPATGYDDPNLSSRPVVGFEPGVVVFLEECEGVWCEVRAAGFRAWLKKENLWGVYETDVFE